MAHKPMKSKNLFRYLLLATVLLTLVESVQAGKLRRLLYYNYSGTMVTNLFGTNDFGTVTFPDTPDAADYMPPVVIGNTPYPPYNMESAVNVAVSRARTAWACLKANMSRTNWRSGWVMLLCAPQVCSS